ncbi:hypothetical protein [Vibrio mediterranei]|uniref:hypothetical protein n=1 Tax=Vibrio mediterranei TaxID=689 RepID=UPI004068097E
MKNNELNLEQVGEGMAGALLELLGWVRDSSYASRNRWIDPNNPNGTAVCTEYALFVSRMRVVNRTDTATLKLTNEDLAQLVSE